MPTAGQILRDLVLERHTELTRLFFVDCRVTPQRPEPLRFMVVRSIITFMRWQDRGKERQ